MTIINIPLTLSSTAPTSMIPEVSALYATGDIEATRECIDQTVQLSMVVSAPCAMGLAVLAQPQRLLSIHQHEAEHHLDAQQQRVKVPIDGRLVQQLNMIAGRNAAEGSHALAV